jgi:hypothetical protein
MKRCLASFVTFKNANQTTMRYYLIAHQNERNKQKIIIIGSGE